VTGSGKETVEILRAYDLTETVWPAAQLAGCDPKTVARYVEARDTGRSPYERAQQAAGHRPVPGQDRAMGGGVGREDPRRRGAPQALAMGFAGNERSTRRAVAEAKAAWKAGRQRTYRPWAC
jgi:hypothetical protein